MIIRHLEEAAEDFQLKIHAVCHVLGYSLNFERTAVQLHDIATILTTIKHVPVKSVCIADKAFNCDYVIDSCKIKKCRGRDSF